LLLSDPPALVKRQDREPVILLVASVLSLTLSGLDPHDRLTWLLEVSPVLFALPLLVVTYSRFRLTPVLYRLLFVHAVILMIGGHYTYSLTPIGFWMQRAFGFARNHYDRIAACSWQVAVLPGHLRLPGRQRTLRADRMVDGARGGRGSTSVPWHSGRSLGYSVGYIPGAGRGDPGASHPESAARPAPDANRLIPAPSSPHPSPLPIGERESYFASSPPTSHRESLYCSASCAVGPPALTPEISRSPARKKRPIAPIAIRWLPPVSMEARPKIIGPKIAAVFPQRA